MSNLRDASRASWAAGSPASIEQINAGSMQRIADAAEKMAQSYDSLRSSRDMYERWYNEQKRRAEKLERSAAALRGVITKLKKRGRR